jgi:hypothetical protein
MPIYLKLAYFWYIMKIKAMKRSATLLFILFSTLFINGCGNETTINEDEASEVIADYLESNPEFKTASFNFGELKFKGEKDQEELRKYEALEENGLIKMDLIEGKKRFLSKDSTYVYQISLTDKAASLVLSQGKDKAKVKTVFYVLDESKPVNFVKSANKTAKATVSLKREETDFYSFDKSQASNSEFITKTYKLKLKKEAGWVVTGE